MFRIGDFSKIAQISGRMLRHYDKISLFKPKHIDPETGYRYYTADQLPELNRILAMKDLGLSLEQVARMMHENVSADEIQGMLNLKKAQIEQTVLEEIAKLRLVELRLNYIRNEGKIPDQEVVIKAIPAQSYASTGRVISHHPDMWKLWDRVVTAGQQLLEHGPMVTVTYNPEMDEALDWQLGYVVPENSSKSLMIPDEFSLNTLPAVGFMATLVHIGAFEGIMVSYNALGSWIGENNYEITGPFREVFLELPPAGSDKDVICELQFPIREPING
jgi:DNA-binding transcriptional MerR regulator/effector-binding domain-containing protein